MMNDVNAAVERFRNGCACSQAVLATYGPRYGLPESHALRVAAGFAGGMRLAETCGAVTGSFMVLGLARCDDSCREAAGRMSAYGAIASFAERFRMRQGSLSCRTLLGCDITTPDGVRLAQERDLFRTKCVEIVRDAASVLEEVLGELR